MKIEEKTPVKDKWSRRFFDRFIAPLLIADPSPVEALLSLLALWWAVVLILGRVYVTGTGFERILNIHGGVEFWAGVFLFLGIALVSSRFAGWLNVERIIVLVSVGVWSFMSALLITLNTISFPGGTYAIVSILGGWAYWRLRYD